MINSSSQGRLYKVVLFSSFCLCAIQLATCHIADIYLDNLLNRCLDGRHHKTKPGPEADLFKQCSPWKDRACCTEKIAKDLHLAETWHRFNYSHCAPMSEQCEKFQRQDLCFYECSPNVGPWLIPQAKTIRKEYFVGVPFCASECNAWWDACKDDYTCVEDWGSGFSWTKSGNQCPENSTCQTFKKMYGSAKNMCEKIWSDSFQVKPDNEPCMRLWFDGNGTNPNEKVAQLKAAEIISASLGGTTRFAVHNILIVIFTLSSLIVPILL
ncbi:folate receptor gamma-like isoform X2 [Amphiura filiformis]